MKIFFKILLLVLLASYPLCITPIYAISDGEGNELLDLETGGEMRVRDNSDNNLMVVQESSGEVGIGIDDPASELQVHDSTGQSTLNVSTDVDVGSGNAISIVMTSDADGTPNPATIGMFNDGAMRFSGQGNLVAPDMILEDSGEVGIGLGTGTPDALLEVGDGTNSMIVDTDGDLQFTGTGDYLVDGDDYAFRYSGGENFGLYFNVTDARYEFTDGTPSRLFSVDTTGNGYLSNALSVGTASSNATLHVDSNGANTAAIAEFENTAGNLQVFRTDATPEGAVTGAIGDLAVDTTNGDVYVKFEGAGNTGWDLLGPGNPFMVYDSSGNQSITGTAATLTLDTEEVADSLYTFSNANDTITFNRDGTYRVSVDVGYEITDNAGGTRGSVETTVQEDTGGTCSSFTNIAYALSGNYHREGSDRLGNSQTWLRSFNANDCIRVQVRRDVGSTNIDTIANFSRVTIERVA